jgi:hypothetical protein
MIRALHIDFGANLQPAMIPKQRADRSLNRPMNFVDQRSIGQDELDVQMADAAVGCRVMDH